jgi:ornithine carbamoyltransferase
MVRHFLTLADLTRDELLRVLDRADALKRLRGRPEHPRPLAGKCIGVLMEKASTRTRVSFEVGIVELGGQPIALAGRDLQMSRDEPLDDTARVLSRYLGGVVLRTYGHDRLCALAHAAAIPVVNALTDKYHPCQILADLMTVRECRRAGFDGLTVAWTGDGNNVAHSWIEAAGLIGFELRVACPPGYAPSPDVVDAARALGRGAITVGTDVQDAVRGADVVTTDVWASMGQEQEHAVRAEAFAGYAVTAGVMRLAARDAVFLHCLPAHRGEEVTAEVIDGPASRVWDEVENRLHAQKALLEFLYT